MTGRNLPVGKTTEQTCSTGLYRSGTEEIFHHPVKTVGAGRTDAGVHAKNQVFHFDKDWQHGEESLLQAIRSHLPKGISPRKVRKSWAPVSCSSFCEGKAVPLPCRKGWAMPRTNASYYRSRIYCLILRK